MGTDQLPIPADVRTAVEGARGVLVLTDSHRDEQAGYERHVAAALAAEAHVTLFLADRGHSDWGVTPFVRGPVALDQARDGDLRSMVEPMEQALAEGAPDVRALAPTIPTLDFLQDAVNTSHANLVVIPERPIHPNLADRLHLTGAFVAAVKDRIPGVPVVVAHPDGSMDLA